MTNTIEQPNKEIEELKNAIRRVLNNDAFFNALDLPRAAEEAAIKLFKRMCSAADPDVHIIREQLLYLENHGQFYQGE